MTQGCKRALQDWEERILGVIHAVGLGLAEFVGALGPVVRRHPNVRMLEATVDDALWQDELATAVPELSGGELPAPTAPGCGVEVDVDVLRAQPWQ